MNYSLHNITHDSHYRIPERKVGKLKILLKYPNSMLFAEFHHGIDGKNFYKIMKQLII